MAKNALEYKGHPLRRKDNLIYFGDMSDPYCTDSDHGQQKGQRSGRGNQGFRAAAADGPGNQNERPYRQKERKRQSVRCHGFGNHLAGAGTDHEIKTRKSIRKAR